MATKADAPTEFTPVITDATSDTATKAGTVIEDAITKKDDIADPANAAPHNTVTDNFRSKVDQPNLHPTEERIPIRASSTPVEKHLEDHASDPAWDSTVTSHPDRTPAQEAKDANKQNAENTKK